LLDGEIALLVGEDRRPGTKGPLDAGRSHEFVTAEGWPCLIKPTTQSMSPRPCAGSRQRGFAQW